MFTLEYRTNLCDCVELNLCVLCLTVVCDKDIYYYYWRAATSVVYSMCVLLAESVHLGECFKVILAAFLGTIHAWAFDGYRIGLSSG